MIRDTDTLSQLLDSVNRFVRERLVPAENHLEEHDEVPADIGTGQAGFVLAILVLAVTLAMGLLAISQLKGASLTAMTFDRATTAHMEPPGTPGTFHFGDSECFLLYPQIGAFRIAAPWLIEVSGLASEPAVPGWPRSVVRR